VGVGETPDSVLIRVWGGSRRPGRDRQLNTQGSPRTQLMSVCA